jgi:hypothetical protein
MEIGTVQLEQFLSLAIEAAKNGEWALTVVACLVLAVFLVRKFLGPKFPFLTTGTGGAVVNIALAALAGLATSMVGGVPFTWGLLAATIFSVMAAGGFSLGKALLASLPAFQAVSPDAEAKAKEAGDAAVKKAAALKSAEDIINGPK